MKKAKQNYYSENDLQKQVVAYLLYKNVLFQTNPYSGMPMSIGMASKAKSLGHNSSFPDLIILEPRRGFHGLFIELKKDGTNLYKKNGQFTSKHLEKQNETIQRLLARNYYAIFSIGFLQARDVIDWYLSGD